MKKLGLLLLIALFANGCAKKHTVDVYKGTNGDAGKDGKDGKDGTSCSVASEFDEEENIVGARISCTDGSFSIVYNGEQGQQGIEGAQGDKGEQGIEGIAGIQGPQGIAGVSCQAYESVPFTGVWLACPDQSPILISNGKDGENGKDGKSCKSIREKNKVKIQCGKNFSYIYDGQDGKDGKKGTSCSAIATEGGANITCGNSSPVFIANGAIGPQGSVGPQGEQGRDGLDGKDGESAIQPGLLCNLHDLKSWDKKTSLPEALANNPIVGTFVLNNLSVPDSQAVNGFPGMPKDLQDLVGIEGYALDCNGYLNIKTSGQHTLKLLSDDGSRLSIEDDYLVIENQGLHAPATVSKTGNLNRGQNKINVVYYQGPVTQIALELKLSGPNTAEAVIPASAFTH